MILLQSLNRPFHDTLITAEDLNAAFFDFFQCPDFANRGLRRVGRSELSRAQRVPGAFAVAGVLARAGGEDSLLDGETCGGRDEED